MRRGITICICANNGLVDKDAEAIVNRITQAIGGGFWFFGSRLPEAMDSATVSSQSLLNTLGVSITGSASGSPLNALFYGVNYENGGDVGSRGLCTYYSSSDSTAEADVDLLSSTNGYASCGKGRPCSR